MLFRHSNEVTPEVTRYLRDSLDDKERMELIRSMLGPGFDAVRKQIVAKAEKQRYAAPANDLGLLLRCETSAGSGHGQVLRSGMLTQPAGHSSSEGGRTQSTGYEVVSMHLV